jgi:hypothetical protein
MTFTSKKVVAAVVGFGLALSIFAAVGVSTASAQAMTLSQLVDLFISLGIISSDKADAAKAAVSSSASAMVYSKDLTVGSSGSEVSALQAKLGVSPATGYFGSITKAAVMAYQAANGVPSTGFVGPLTRAKLNGSVAASGSTSGSTTVVNSGIEGTLTVAEESVSNSSVREGDTMKPLLGISVEAKLSDINIQRIKLDLGTTTSFYTKVYKTLYVVDASGKVLAQADLNSNTVTKNGANYELTFGGLNYVVQKDQEKVLTVKADLYASIKDADKGNKTIQLVLNGVRGVDGAGIDQYGPSAAFGETIAVTTSLVDSATIKLSTNSSNVKAADLIAAEGSNEDELLDSSAPTVLLFDLRAEKDNVLVTDIAATVAKTGTGAATATKAYLYDGSNLIETGTINATSGAVTFDDIDYTVQKDTTKTLAIKVDIRTADATVSSITASVAASGITSENSAGTNLTATGSATGEAMAVRNVGAVFALVGTPSMARTAVSSNDTSGIATSTGSANFTVSITAKGSDLTFGSTASSTTIFGDNSTATTTTGALAVYKNGASFGSLTTVSAGGTTPVVSYSVPSSGVTTLGQSFTLAENNTVQIPVTVSFTVAGASANTYAVQINGFRWQATAQATSSSMTNKSEWRSSAVSLP